MENQEANELAQISSGYKVSKSRLKGIIEIQEKMVLNVPSSPNMAIPKTWGKGTPTAASAENAVPAATDVSTTNVLKIPSLKFLFGIPETITTDQGSVFVGQNMQEFTVEIGFKLKTSTPYYAQANGQVEAAKKVIISLIIKHVSKKPKNWHKTLDQILWARRTSPKEATNSIPFRLTYGHDVVLPIEICLQSVRVQLQKDIQSEQYWELMFDKLTDLDEQRLVVMEVLIRQKACVARVYNIRVETETFAVNDYVWKVILPMDQRDRTLGKWSPKWEG
ncbi:uncharacterized protein LOC127101929 [Lathyrus oleraceus]|uniref:uncharacterized protein LOC127101929 n=1 Tax=Pisum sativum TaxID=3888 RepID=UPI0021CF2790|nr:uncharacterized protein LOC127101929 [Pisum sativum]